MTNVVIVTETWVAEVPADGGVLLPRRSKHGVEVRQSGHTTDKNYS
jgi:hypothetical protein